MSDDIERSESGSPIYRHKPREQAWEAPQHPGKYLDEIDAHVERYIGKVETVFHEILSDMVHLDVHFVPATKERPFHVLVTSGVSDEPMNVPEGMEEFRRAELLMALPRHWPLTQEDFKREENYWPVRWLKQIGRLPHEYNTWIGWGHSIPNGDPAEPIANTDFIGVMVTPAQWLPMEFFQLTANDGEKISFYELVPLYQEEIDLKMKQGAEELEERLAKVGGGVALDVKRPNVAKKKGWLW
jgi:hypothetical protein